MECRVWTTESVTQGERFAFRREAVLEGLLGVAGERFPGDAPNFRARVTAWNGPGFKRMHYQAEAHLAFRRPQDITRKTWDAYWISRDIGGGVCYDIAGREFVTRPDDLTVTHSDLTLAARNDVKGVNFDAWIIPRAKIEPHLPARGRRLSLTLPAESGLKVLVTSYIDSLGRHLDMLSDAEGEQAVDVLSRLVGVACGAAIPEHISALRGARLEQIKCYVDDHLTETDLTPGKVAAALRISVRSLHLAFEPTGTSFAEHVMRRRVQECRTALERSASARSVTDVAFAGGFANLTTFYRAFRREFGQAPGALRGVTGGSL
jgi:AraC-like DNA-binding protein